MSRIAELFERKNERILNIYCTAGYPKPDSTLKVIKALQEYGADMIELGMPYSDPLADGPVIQASSTVALKNGMTIKKLFEQLKDLRKSPAKGGVGEALPVILMGYMNPVLQYGFERFCADAAAAGIDGLILPDLPEYEFETEYGPIMQKHGLDYIFLVTPETSEERIRKLDELSTGFLYAVSSSSTTGSNKNMTEVNSYLQKLKNLGLRNLILVGFGIKDRETFNAACEHANGAIIDPLTGARRDDILISAEDLARLQIDVGTRVTLRSAHGSFTGRLLAAPIKPGNLEVHWPEGNVLLAGDRLDPESMEPDYNAVVSLERAANTPPPQS